MKEEVCCPKFNPKPWDNKVFTWKEKRFVKGNVFTLFYMPINFGSVITNLMKKIDASKAKTSNLCLSEHSSMFNMSIYIDVDCEVKGAKNTTINGTFLSKVYEGEYKDTGKWCKDYEEYAKKKGYSIKKWYMWYTTCPACAKKYGKNYTVIINEVEKL